MKTRHGEYGLDLPWVPLFLVLGAAPCLFLGGVRWMLGDHGGGLALFAGGALMAFGAVTFLFTTRRGKFQVWDELLRPLRGDERVLDVGCGRGAVSLLAAQRLESGRVVAVDTWSAQGQTDNTEANFWRNAEAEGVKDKVEVRTADMRQLPFDDGTFDWVVSNLALHEVPKFEERAQAVRELARVLKPGGTLLLADTRDTNTYASTLEKAGLHGVNVRSLGPRAWYGGPWNATKLVTARK